MKTLRTATEVRNGITKALNVENGKVAVIATIPISKRKQDLGIQFWTARDLINGYAVNSDNTVSNFVEYL